MQQQADEAVIFAVLGLLGLCIIVVFLFILFQKKKNVLLKKELETKKWFEQEILSTQLEIQQQTMQHIGREIHDNIGQQLTLVSLYTQQLSLEATAVEMKSKINHISHIVNQSLSELRALSKSLTNDGIRHTPIATLLKSACNTINELKVCHVNFTANMGQIDLDYHQKTVLLRITQEFLQNSIKHANSKNCNLILNMQADFLILELTDDGKGFDVNKLTNSGIGINNMKKRTKMIGGTFILESHSGQGTTLKIQIPIKNEN